MHNFRSVSRRGTRRSASLSSRSLLGGLGLLGLLLLSSPALAQDGKPKPPPLFKPGSQEHKDAKLALQPGVLPQEATPEAIALWKRAIVATRAPAAEGEAAPVHKPVDSFRLTFDLTWKNGPQRNDIPGAQLSFLAPSFIRTTLGSGRQFLRGPEGDFLIDGEKPIPIEGREAKEDRRQLDDMTGLARNFLSLVNPDRLRLRVLEETAAPKGLPSKHSEEAKNLQWLRIESPDFFLVDGDRNDAPRPPFGSSKKSTMYSVKLGIERSSGRISMAEILHLRATGEWSRSPLFLRFDKLFEREGFLIPAHMFIYEVERGSSRKGYIYRSIAKSSLYLKTTVTNAISLRPDLKPEDFLPPTVEKK